MANSYVDLARIPTDWRSQDLIEVLPAAVYRLSDIMVDGAFDD